MNGIRRKRRMLALLIPLILTASFKSSSQPSADLTSAATEIITFNDDGGWSWFEDERAIVHKSKVIIGSVAAGGRGQRHQRANLQFLSGLQRQLQALFRLFR